MGDGVFGAFGGKVYITLYVDSHSQPTVVDLGYLTLANVHLLPASSSVLLCLSLRCSRWLCDSLPTPLLKEEGWGRLDGTRMRGALASGETAAQQSAGRPASTLKAIARSRPPPLPQLLRVRNSRHGGAEVSQPHFGRLPHLLPRPLSPRLQLPPPAGPQPRTLRMASTSALQWATRDGRPPPLQLPLLGLQPWTLARPRRFISSSPQATTPTTLRITTRSKAATRYTRTTSSAWQRRHRSAAHSLTHSSVHTHSFCFDHRLWTC